MPLCKVLKRSCLKQGMAQQHYVVIAPEQPFIDNEGRHTERTLLYRFRRNPLSLFPCVLIIKCGCKGVSVQSYPASACDTYSAVHGRQIVGENRAKQCMSVGLGDAEPPRRQARAGWGQEQDGHAARGRAHHKAPPMLQRPSADSPSHIGRSHSCRQRDCARHAPSQSAERCLQRAS